MAKKFNIQIRSTYPEIWRYNIAISCGCTDTAGQVVEVVGEQDNVAAVGSNLKAAPEDFSLPREVRLSTPEAEGIGARHCRDGALQTQRQGLCRPRYYI